MACSGPYKRGTRAVGVIAVGVAPWVDKVVGGFAGIDHRGFGFEVPFAGGGRRQSRRSDKAAEEIRCAGWSSHCRGAGSADGVGIVICIVAVAGSLQGGDLGFGGGCGTVTANGTCGTEGKASEDTDDGDDSEEFDEGERGMGAIFVLVERWKCGCSHNDDLNFISQISKGKKRILHPGGVVSGNLDHRASGGLGFASDQRGDQGGQEGRGELDGRIDQDSSERILCGVFGISVEHKRDDGSRFFNPH